MSPMRFLLLAAVGVDFTIAQVCTEVYPHLSCGLSITTEPDCVAAGCCWDATPNALNSCFAPKINGYSFEEMASSPSGTSGTLSLIQPSGLLGPDFTTLTLDITQETADRTHIKIVPSTALYGERWEVPEDLLPRPGGEFVGTSNSKYVVSSSMEDPGQPLELFVTRTPGGTPTNEVIFILSKMLVFQDQYLQFVLGTPPDNAALFGIGESTRAVQQLTANSSYTLWNTDIAAAVFDVSLYGSHPFLIQISKTGKASGILFMNSNAMDISVFNSDSMGNSVGVQSIGGVIDLYVFAGPTPADVVKQFQAVVGKPAMVPFWSLGFHNCKWGYVNATEVTDVVANYSAANIPLETQWVDIDYMHAYLDFTLDEVNFPQSQMTVLVNSLHANNQHFVPIVDPGIYVSDPTNPTFVRGLEENVFVNDMNANPYLGQVWPGPTYFPDWYAENTTAWWSKEIAEFHNLLDFDGLWIDMNEVANFCNQDGQAQVCTLKADPTDCPNGCCLDCTTPDPTSSLDFPPFLPHVAQKNMGGKTMSMTSVHAGNILEYNTHNLYGFMESIATRKALVSALPNRRPFILSRSTFLGSGVHTAHWTGDNAATWNDLAASIVTMNNMALFGMPMIGADICGFIDDTTEELCGRWISVGAFSPFSRDHNIEGALPQELYRWDSVAEASRFVLGLRYQLLPHLYTLMYLAHRDGEMVHNAMWTRFPEDPVTLSRDGQYMWSHSLLFTPVLVEGATDVSGYFPKALWYSLTDDGFIDATVAGQSVTFVTPVSTTNVHVRGGSIVPMQSAGMTTKAVKESAFTLLVALDETGSAAGSLFLDDGVQNELTTVTFVEYVLEGGRLLSTLADGSTYISSLALETVEIRGIDRSYGTSCTAQLTIQPAVVETPEVVTPSSTVVSVGEFYSTLTLQFEGVQIDSNFVLTFDCVESSGDDDDEDIFSDVYVQVVVSIVAIACFVALLFLGAKLHAASKQKPENENENENENEEALLGR